jgi:hypothetical protein
MKPNAKDCGCAHSHPASVPSHPCRPLRGVAERRDAAEAPRPRQGTGIPDAFTRGYIEAAIWSSLDDRGEPLDERFGIDSIDPETFRAMKHDAAKFQRENEELLHQAYTQRRLIPVRYDEGRAGHDFWLTRNGHGAGFWDRDLGDVGDKLTKAAKAYGQFDLYVGDDGKIYGSPLFGHPAVANEDGGFVTKRVETYKGWRVELQHDDESDTWRARISQGGRGLIVRGGKTERATSIAAAKAIDEELGGDQGSYAGETVPVVYEAGAEASPKTEFRKKREREKRARAEVFKQLWLDPEYIRLQEHKDKVIHQWNRIDAFKHSARPGELENAERAVKRATHNLQQYEDEALKKAGVAYEARGAEEDYIAVNSSGRQVAGPFKNYDEAKRIADQQGGVVKYAFEAPGAPHGASHEARDDSHGLQEAREAAEAPDGCLPWVKVAKDPARYEGCLARAQALGPIQTPEALYNLLAPTMEKEDQEIFVVVLLDIRFQLRGVAEVARGQRSRVGVGVNDVMRIVLVSGAEHFAVAHCHPSGKAKPSPADRDLTKAIEGATNVLNVPQGGIGAIGPYSEITFLDHIVIGHGEYYSIRENKLHHVKRAPTQPRGALGVFIKAQPKKRRKS